MENKYLPKKYKITEFVRETPDSFTLTVKCKMNHDPGQFVQVSLPGIGEAPISICSYSNNSIKLNIREVGNVTNNLSKLRKNNEIFLRGPYGNGYPMKELEKKDLIIIGGGCGVAPLKGVIDYIEQFQKFGSIHIFLGYRSEQDIIFKNDVEQWYKNYDVRMTLDKKAHGKTCYEAKKGFVTDSLNSSNLSPDNKAVLICGPPIMTKFTIDSLKKKGFTNNQIYISSERLMYCGIGICCHCMIKHKFTCKDGPVFRYDTIEND